MTQDTIITTPPVATDDSLLHWPPLQLADSLLVSAEEAPSEYLLMCDDSIAARHAAAQPASRQSLFSGSVKSQPESLPQPRPAEVNTDWIFGAIILLVLLVSINLNAQRYRLKDLFLSIFDARVRERVWRENHIRTSTLLPGTGIYVAALALILFCMVQRYQLLAFNSAPLLYLTIIGAVVAFVLVRNGLIRLLGTIFDAAGSSLAYITNSHLFYMVGSLMLPPLLLLIFFGSGSLSSIALKVALVLLIILFVVRVLRGLQLFLTNTGSIKLYLFYYFCILEIAPILVMVKIFLT